MDAKTLLDIVNTRIQASDGNPTSKSFLFELLEALKRLQEYEENDKEQKE